MQYISPDNEYPRYLGDIQIAHPEYKEGDPLPDGWTLVVSVPMREDWSEDETVYEDFPVEVDGVMTQNWKIRPLTAEEIERRDAPRLAKQKLLDLGFTDLEIKAISRGLT